MAVHRPRELDPAICAGARSLICCTINFWVVACRGELVRRVFIGRTEAGRLRGEPRAAPGPRPHGRSVTSAIGRCRSRPPITGSERARYAPRSAPTEGGHV